MGVRIDVGAAAAGANGAAGVGSKQGSGKKGDLTEGLRSDFGQELERAGSKKKAEVAQEPVEKAKPAAKLGKKQAKGKVREEEGGEAEVRVEGKGKADKKPVEEVTGDEEVVAVEEGEEVAVAEEGEVAESVDVPVITEQFAVQVNAAPVRMEDTPVAQEGTEGEVAEDVQAVDGVESKPVAWEQGEIVRPVAVEGDEEVDVAPLAEEEGAKPQAAVEMKASVRPVEKKRETRGERGDDWGGGEVVVPEAGDVKAKEEIAPIERFAELFEAVNDPVPVAKVGEVVEQAKPVLDVLVPGMTGESQGQQDGGVRDVKGAQQPLPVAPEVRFAEENHPKVVTAVKTQLLPGGGSIQLRLDPPDLGPLRLEVTMSEGVMSASFVAGSDQAASLLTHSLGQLKHALEGAGISVDKLQVRQGGQEQMAGDAERQKQQAAGDQSSARQEQQRREMLERMWRKVAGGDPLDLVA
jgi:hypothetical protein